MPLFNVDVEKTYGGEYWTNRYVVNTPDLAAAASVATGIVAVERAVHYDSVTFTKARVSDQIPDNDQLANIVVGQPGLRNSSVASYLPLFNVAVIDFAPLFGRPSRKYLRLPISESDVDNPGNLTPAMRTFLQDNYVTPMLAINQYVDVDGEEFVTGAVKTPVGMRQLRRGSKRKTPVLPPGNEI